MNEIIIEILLFISDGFFLIFGSWVKQLWNTSISSLENTLMTLSGSFPIIFWHPNRLILSLAKISLRNHLQNWSLSLRIPQLWYCWHIAGIVGITVAGNSDGMGLVRRRKRSLRSKSSKHMKRIFFLLPVETAASRRAWTYPSLSEKKVNWIHNLWNVKPFPIPACSRSVTLILRYGLW